jgi:hypothetical protein
LLEVDGLLDKQKFKLKRNLSGIRTLHRVNSVLRKTLRDFLVG